MRERCTCNRVKNDVYTLDQCWDCWKYLHVRAWQAGAGLPATGKYRNDREAIAHLNLGKKSPPQSMHRPRLPNPALQLPIVCVHEGEVLEECKGCQGGLRSVRECGVYGTCTRVKVDDEHRDCSNCERHQTKLFSKTDPSEDDYPDPLPTHTKRDDEAAQIAAFRSIVSNCPPYPGDDGRYGLIWTCHSPKFWPMVVINIRILRNELKCELPVEVWYRSSVGKLRTEDVSGLGGIEFKDRDWIVTQQEKDSRLPLGIAEKGGWEVKTYAATHTKMQKFWVLDSDAGFVANPTHAIPNCPFGYWIDLEAWKTGRVKWDKFGMENREADYPQIQGGHLWFDRSKPGCWHYLTVAHQLNEHSDWWYSHSFDDQSCLRAALAAGVCPDYRTFGDLNESDGWRSIAHVCKYEGKELISHYCQGKLFLPEVRSCDTVPLDALRRQEFAKLVQEYVN